MMEKYVNLILPEKPAKCIEKGKTTLSEISDEAQITFHYENCGKKGEIIEDIKKKRRTYGEHLTSINIFKEFILSGIKESIYQYRWVDLFCGEGNLILPILELIPEEKRVDFFKKHIFLFDIQKELIKKAICNAIKYGIPEEIAQQNIVQQDTIKNYPSIVLSNDLPLFHITNPPYLYVGYIAKHRETYKYLDYFQGINKGYQDLYQLALINDLQNEVKKMIYIIPSNFLFGFSSSNKIRDDFLSHYTIGKAFIFEKKIFEFTGVNVAICFFERKSSPERKKITFEGTKINKEAQKKVYTLEPYNHYRAGNEFEDFVKQRKALNPIKATYYLTMEEVEKNKGNKEILIIDANAFNGKEYEKKIIHTNNELYNKINKNILFIRTVDTGSFNGRAGLYLINKTFNANGILVSKSTYRTHPIQIFLEPVLSKNDQLLLKDYFNTVLQYFRKTTDSEFMTTYKYSNSEYTRKYLGLTQAKDLIETFPILQLSKKEKNDLKKLIEAQDIHSIISFLKSFNKFKELSL
jgi:methylase of polypeptide subunit release factors